jgi:two-component system, OmpR family, alkaline phosphatase synthesis response regulator PhoP
MAKENILVVEDEEDIQELITYNLTKEGYRVAAVASGEDAMAAVAKQPPDLILLDLMLPGADGLEVCRMLKNDVTARDIPIVMVTAKGEEADVVVGLELGADDYITKPFSPKVMIARVRAVLRRTRVRPDEDVADIKIHDLIIKPGRHEALVDGEKVDLTVTEFKLLHLLARRPGWVYTRYQIVDALHGDDYPVTDRSIDVQIVGLRKKLGRAGSYIETVRGVGYRFKD